MLPLICGIQKNKYTKQKQTHRYRGQSSGSQWGRVWEGGKIEVGD